MSETDQPETVTDEPETEGAPQSVKDQVPDKPEVEDFAPFAPDAKVASYPGGWHLVEKGSWQVSIAPDGLLMLPRHLHPNEVEEFCNAALAAAGVGARQIEVNDAKTTPQPTEEELAQAGGPVITEAGAEMPVHAMRMPITPRAASATAGGGIPQDRSTIGRPRRRDPRAPRTTQPPAPPTPGAVAGGRRGRQDTQ